MTKNGTWQVKHKSVRFTGMFLFAVIDRFGYLLAVFQNKDSAINWAALNTGSTVSAIKS